ncbi:Ca-activated chloride channel family protein [Cyclonatronum proteinivorum]|uniref:Ca-activated chloride channel family protein n=1 Tax=Cyclonatronum proteinivorum TaxID=1457365 RepID=A0A345UK84_9BACT|nr:VWA domain-containing protein [Cyclonatronum proteinivorum]AXJ00886.1 Ca-activated chloride channel family protein [Cyclonatronum proteinivorum]
MIWEHPSLLFLLILPVLFAALSYFFGKWRQKKLRAFFSDEMLRRLSNPVWSRGRTARTILLYLGITLLVIGAAGPKIGSEIREISREGVDLIIALDVSRSMQAQDIRPSRLDKAKFEISSLIDRLQGDRVGLILFTNTAFLQCPLTTDYSAFRMYLDLASTDQLPFPGTDFNAPLQLARDTFRSRTRQEQQAAQVLLFISDGEDHSPSIEFTLNQLINDGVFVYTVGIGTQAGAPIPIYNQAGQFTGNHVDRDGREVISRLEPDLLREMAQAGRGVYYEIRRGADRIDGFTAQLVDLERREFATEQFSDYANRYQWPAAAGLLFLLVSFMIPVYKPVKIER